MTVEMEEMPLSQRRSKRNAQRTMNPEEEKENDATRGELKDSSKDTEPIDTEEPPTDVPMDTEIMETTQTDDSFHIAETSLSVSIPAPGTSQSPSVVTPTEWGNEGWSNDAQ